jgi:hypothetical protein
LRFAPFSAPAQGREYSSANSSEPDKTEKEMRAAPGKIVSFILATGTAMSVMFGTVTVGLAQSTEAPRLETNQSQIEELTHPATLAVADPMAVFAFVLASLPDQVKVYPTGNYYYFRFVHAGLQYAGNIRLDAISRAEGKVNFDYYIDTTEWKDDHPVMHRLLDASMGVNVEKDFLPRPQRRLRAQ